MSVKNLVQCPLITPVSSTATELLLGAVSAPYSLPPLDGGILVIADSVGKPSFVEFIKYTHRIDNVLYGVSRGQEETTARNWSGVTYVYQALTADQYTSELESKVDKAAGESLMLDAERTKLAGIQAGAQVNSVTSVAGKTGAVSLTKADVGLGNVDNTSDASKPVSTAQQTALNAKAPLASPVFTGSPKAPTPLTTDNSTLLATTAFVKAVVAALVDSSPAALDTLNELAAALGDDPNFATTMTNALALKAPLASPALTGNPTAPTQAADDNDTSIATTAFVRAAMALFGLGAERAYSGDLNDLITPGLYSVTGGSTNWPFGGSGGTLIVLMHGGGDYASQLALSVTDSRILKRAKVGASWSEWQELWNTENLVKQTSPTDTTAGAMMAVGAFGLGANTPEWSNTTLNDFTVPTGFYRATSSVTDTPWADYWGVAIEKAPDGAYVRQSIWCLNNATRIFERVISAGIAVPWREIWHTGNLTKQTSPTDTTAGALMAVGAFGIGGVAVNLSSPNMNDPRVSGLYYCSGGSNGPMANFYGWLRVEDVTTGAYTYQTAFDVTGKKWHRALSFHTGWTRWSQVYEQASIIGTVSQLNGVPTGAIIERGSNANGEYVRFADGTQICSRSVGFPGDGPRETYVEYAWPAAFANTNYTVELTPNSYGFLVTNIKPSAKLDQPISKTLSTNSSSITVSTGGGFEVNVTATGRWY